MDVRDPLFSVIAFFAIVLISVLITIGVGKIREFLREREIETLLNEFSYVEVENIPVTKDSSNALLLLAKAYEKNGDYEKALKIYLLLQKHTHSLNILKNIAHLYFKAGFLEKAENIVYKILKVSPREKDALKLLILIKEKLHRYKEIVDILEVFEELGEEIERERANALIKLFVFRKCDLKEFCDGISEFEDIYKRYPFVRREFVEYLFRVNPKRAYEVLDVYLDLDLYWNRGDIPKSNKFCNVLAAKKLTKCDKKAPFEIEALKYLPSDLAELEFEYVCDNCKRVFPLYSSRCPNCNELFSKKLITKLSEKQPIENIEF